MMAPVTLTANSVDAIKPYPAPSSADPEIQEQLLGLWESGKDFVILSGPPGVGKTRAAEDLVLEMLDKYNAPHDRDVCRISILFPEFRSRVYTEDDIRTELISNKIQFVWDICVLHPQYTYEDLMRGYRLFPGAAAGMALEVREGLLGFTARVLSVLAAITSESNLPRGMLILDEINRAPIGQLFGEAIYALDRRGSSVVTPYDLSGSGCSVSIPHSLYLLGTMNSIDRATSGFDFALRRRFTLLNLHPLKQPVSDYFESISTSLGSIATSLYERLESLILNSEQAGVVPKSELIIGHAYFLPSNKLLDDEGAIDWLGKSYLYRILPTILDYQEQGLLEFKDKDIDLLPCGYLMRGDVPPEVGILGTVIGELKTYSVAGMVDDVPSDTGEEESSS